MKIRRAKPGDEKSSVKLRKYKISDIDKHLELLVMNKVYRGINKKNKLKELEWLRKSIESYKKKTPKFYVLVIIYDGFLVGNVIAEKINWNGKQPILVFGLGKIIRKKVLRLDH